MIWSLKLNQITSLKKSYYIRINSFQISFLFDLLKVQLSDSFGASPHPQSWTSWVYHGPGSQQFLYVLNY